jgi:uncharacterized protein (TIGR02996 family)
MPQHDDFLRAILADPDEDAPRLVYADWLDEHGDPRGEFIRVQIERARLDEDDPRQAGLKQRDAELFGRNGKQWVAPFAPLLNVQDSGVEWGSGNGVMPWWQSWFDRGFVGRLCMWAKGFLSCADDLLRLAPLRRLHLRIGRGEVRQLAHCPSLARIAELELDSHDGRGLDSGAMGVLARFPNLTGLRRLNLECNRLRDGGAIALAGAPWLTQVRELDLSGNDITADGVRSLVGSDHLGPLSGLHLSRNRFGDDGAVALANHPALAMLRSLSLAECGLGPAGAGALVRSRSLARLSDLDLSGNVLGPVVAEHLAGVMSLRLDRLNLENCELGDRGVRLLASWPGLANLRRLSLPCNGISDSGAEALAASPYLGRLAVLDLGGNDLSREAEERLQRAPSLRHLWRLETFPF